MVAEQLPLEQIQRETFELAQGFFGIGSFLLLAAFVLACLLGFFVLSIAVAPDMTRRMGQAVSERYILSFIAGLPIAAVLFVSLHVGRTVPWIGAAGFMTTVVLGGLALAASSESLGRRVFWTAGKLGNRPVHAIVGGAVLGTVGVVPVVGWIIAAYALVSGLGSLVIGLFPCRANAPVPISTLRA